MKKLIFTLLTCSFIYSQINAQYCGGSGSGVCSPSGQLSKPGLSPLSECLAPIYVDSTYNITIQFQNYDTVSVAGNTVTVQSLTIDSINNLPPGLCWASNKSNNTFATNENGCINVSGTVSNSATPGQYRLSIAVTVTVSILGQLAINAAAEGLFYYVRLKASPADTCPRYVDTTGQTYEQSHPFVNTFMAYGAACDTGGVETCAQATSIHDIISYINTLDIIPNPVSNEATVKFSSTKTGKITEKITNVIGSEVYSNQLQLNLGQNTHTISKGNLAAGVYIYSLSDGESVYSKKLVISE